MRRFISITAILGILSGLWLTVPAMQVGAALPSTTVPATTIAPATRGTTAQIAPTLPPPATVAAPQAPSPLFAPPNSGDGRRVVYSKGSMRVWIIEPDGQVLISYRVSGRLDQPSYGTYSVYSALGLHLLHHGTERLHEVDGALRQGARGRQHWFPRDPRQERCARAERQPVGSTPVRWLCAPEHLGCLRNVELGERGYQGCSDPLDEKFQGVSVVPIRVTAPHPSDSGPSE